MRRRLHREQLLHAPHYQYRHQQHRYYKTQPYGFSHVCFPVGGDAKALARPILIAQKPKQTHPVQERTRTTLAAPAVWILCPWRWHSPWPTAEMFATQLTGCAKAHKHYDALYFAPNTATIGQHLRQGNSGVWLAFAPPQTRTTYLTPQDKHSVYDLLPHAPRITHVPLTHGVQHAAPT